MLLCNTCVNNNERGSFIRSRIVANVKKLNIGEKLQMIEANVTTLVSKKVVKALKTTQDKVEKTYSSVLDAKTQKVSSKQQPLKQQNVTP